MAPRLTFSLAALFAFLQLPISKPAITYPRTEEDVRAEKWSLKKQLTSTVHAIYQEKARTRGIENLERWFQALQNEKRLHPGESELDREQRIAAWQRVNPCPDQETYRWLRQYEQLRNCQAQWIGYRAACCGAATRPMAVPIGCRHRLCPLCCSHRAKAAKEKIRALFDEVTNPVLITLTMPNQASIQKSDFKLFRKQVRAFFKRHAWKPATESETESGWIKGPVYALETRCYQEGSLFKRGTRKKVWSRAGGKT